MAGCGCGGSGKAYSQYMQMANLPEQYSPMMAMPQDQLEMMYPKTYYTVFPAVQGYCDMMGFKPGVMFTPSQQQIEQMVDGIYNSVEGQVGAEEDMMESMETRQPFYGPGFGPGFGQGYGLGFGRRRPFLRDLIGILLIRELLRRRRGYGGYPGYIY